MIDDPAGRARSWRTSAVLKIGAGEVERGHAMLLAEAEQVAELDPMYAGAMLSLAANLPVFRLQARAAVELMERAWLLGDPARPRHADRAAHQRTRQDDGRRRAGPALLVELAARLEEGRPVGHRQISAVGWPLVWVEEYDAARTTLSWAATCCGRAAR